MHSWMLTSILVFPALLTSTLVLGIVRSSPLWVGGGTAVKLSVGTMCRSGWAALAVALGLKKGPDSYTNRPFD